MGVVSADCGALALSSTCFAPTPTGTAGRRIERLERRAREEVGGRITRSPASIRYCGASVIRPLPWPAMRSCTPCTPYLVRQARTLRQPPPQPHSPSDYSCINKTASSAVYSVSSALFSSLSPTPLGPVPRRSRPIKGTGHRVTHGVLTVSRAP